MSNVVLEGMEVKRVEGRWIMRVRGSKFWTNMGRILTMGWDKWR